MNKFNLIITEDGEGSVSFVSEGTLKTIPHDHPNFRAIADALVNGQDPTAIETGTSLTDLLDVAKAVARLGERVSTDGTTVFFDGVPVHSNLTTTILRYRYEGRDPAGLVRFMERLASNPDEHSRQNLWDWVDAQDLTIDADGFFYAFKGVDELLNSISSGHAVVDGVDYYGKIPYAIGSTVTMPREEVNHNPSEGCSTGLHVGTYQYANDFGRTLLEVKVDPADVVSVPTDCGAQKMRTCRLFVVDRHDKVGSLSNYEPTSWTEEATVDALAEAGVPSGFLARLRKRWGRKSFAEALAAEQA
jgi:hypothetical protein